MSTTTSTTTTPLRSLKIKANECIVMPGNAKIKTVYASSNNIDVESADCPDLADDIVNKIEVAECYIMGLIFHHDDNRFVEPWTNDRTTIQGLWVGDKFYSSGLGNGNDIGDGGDCSLQSIRSIMQNNADLKDVITCIGLASGANGEKDTGGACTICFKTLPSIAKTMYIQTTTGQEWNNASDFIAKFPARKIGDWDLNNVKCGCTC